MMVLVASTTTMALPPVKVDKCATCGLPIGRCQYKGKHPKPKKETSKPKAKCHTCGKTIDNCPYGGKHPAPVKNCSTCGLPVNKCQYNGTHPKCPTCGQVVDSCKFNGNHPTAFEVSFSSNLSDATMFIDGVNYGTASGSRMLKPGLHSVKLTAKCYHDLDTTITVNENNTNFKFSMSRKFISGRVVDNSGKPLNFGVTIQVSRTNEIHNIGYGGVFTIENIKDGDELIVNYETIKSAIDGIYGNIYQYNESFIIQPGQSSLDIIIDKSKMIKKLSNVTLTGTVHDTEGNPLIGAQVWVKGTDRVTTTGIYGEYSIEVSSGEWLEVRCVGYKSLSSKVQNQSVINFGLSESK